MVGMDRGSRAGFTMIEFILVVAISAIVIIGLGAVVEVPRQALEREDSGAGRVSDCDRAVARLEEEIRFAADVAVPDSRTLDISTSSGDVIRYQWDGSSGGELIRTAPGDLGAVLKNIQDLVFDLSLTAQTVPVTDDVPLVLTPVQTSGFDDFLLLPGYEFEGTGPLVVVGAVVDVTEVIGAYTIDQTHRAAVLITATGIDGDDATAASLRLRLRRNGSENLRIQIFERQDKKVEPKRQKLLATATVLSGSLPVSFADVNIPLSSVEKLKDQKGYFIEISSAGPGSAADLETRSLSDADGAGAAGSALAVSDSAGAAYDYLAARDVAGQTTFSLTAVMAEAVVPAAASAEMVQLIPTSVQLKVRLVSDTGGAVLSVSFPVENNLALLER